LSTYLPTPLSESELEALVHSAIQDTGASGPQDMGKVMSAVMGKVGARADGKRVSQMARRLLEKA